jgi:hypothetical protein
MENRIHSFEEIEAAIAECQKRLAVVHGMLIEDELAEEDKVRLNEEMKDLRNRMFFYQQELRKKYSDDFAKPGAELLRK